MKGRALVSGRNVPVVVLMICIALGGLMFWSASALAVRQHVFSSSFGSEGTGNGQLKEPAGVAVNESTGDVYVVDKNNNRVEEFSSSGSYEDQFNGAGSPTGVFSSPEGIAVDNSTNPLEDPSAGDVYVVDTGHSVIDKFSAAGEYIGQLTETSGGSPFEGLDGVAVDSNGVVWVYQESGEIDSFSNAVANEFLASRNSQAFGTFPGLAVDSEDNLYVNTAFEVFAKLNSSGEVLSEEVDAGEQATAAAVDSSSNDVYIDNVSTVGAFSPSGALIERFGSGHLTGGSGIAVDSKTGDVYVADSAVDEVDLFIPEPPSLPTIRVFSRNVTSTSGDLNAQINPHGADTTYYFQYGTVSCAASPSSCTDVPAAPGTDIGEGFGDQSASVHLQNLLPSTTYYYRVVAHNNPFGTAASPDHTFTTQGTGTGFVLPDDRAWELVSPPNKHGAAIEAITGEGGVIQASGDGDAISYVADAPIEAEPKGNPARELTQVLSTRRPEGWDSQDIATPHDAVTGVQAGNPAEYKFFSPNLSLGLVEQLGNDETPLSGPSEKTVYLRHDATCEATPMTCYEPLVTDKNVPLGTKFGHRLGFVGATPDLTHIVLESGVALTSTAAANGGLYEWTGGHLQLVSVLPGPGETPAEGPVGLGYIDSNVRHAISDNGSRIIWVTEESGNHHLYMRDMTKGETVQLDAVEPGAEGGEGEPQFQTASEDGSKVFFTDAQQLTVGSTAGQGKPDLYEFEATSDSGPLAGRLTDLTVDHNPGERADVQGVVLGASEDGSYVYFVANGVLAGGAAPGHCEPGHPPEATCNLYLGHDGTITFIAALPNEDGPNWEGQNGHLGNVTSRVSPSGRYLAFMSNRSLTGYDNLDANSGVYDEEVFLYDANAGRLVCASCDPTGARPIGVFDSEEFPGLLVDRRGAWKGHWLAGSIPGWTSVDLVHALYQSRYLSDSGRLFFDSADTLVPQDTNGKEDVYEYEPEGTYGCTRASETFSEKSGGCVGLISSGTSSEESAFLDASESGNDVFFLTASQLAPRDDDTALDVYDAHDCQASPCPRTPAVSPPACNTSDSCKPAPSPQPAIFGASGSATFSGGGNLVPPVSKPATKPLTRAQKLAKALKACKKLKKKKRVACVRQARKKYGPVKKKGKSTIRSQKGRH